MSYPYEVCCVRDKTHDIKRYGYIVSTYEAQRYIYDNPQSPEQMFPVEGPYYVLLCESNNYKAAWLKPVRENYRADGVVDVYFTKGTFEEMYALWQSYARML